MHTRCQIIESDAHHQTANPLQQLDCRRIILVQQNVFRDFDLQKVRCETCFSQHTLNGLPAEQFYIGGPLLGRAFAAGALGGDTGVTGLFEVRFDQKFEVQPVLGYQLYAFLGAGIVWNRGSTEYEALSSYGAGVRVSLQDGYRAGFEIALPIDYHSSTSHDVHISLSKSFKS